AGETRRIGIRRVHMEEDTGKLTHLDNGDGSLVDYNRSGVPLLEIVSEPDLRSAEEANVYASKIRQLLRYLGVNSGDMEKGVIRFEANVSVRPAGTNQLNTRTEIKNLNSFRALTGGIDYEVARQAALLAAGGTIQQATLGWNETRRETVTQRIKEEADDYRYFPEPDLPPLHIDPAWTAEVAAALPELPDAKIARYSSGFGLSAYDATLLAEDRPVAEWYDAAVAAGGDAKQVANWVLNNLFSLLNEQKLGLGQIPLTPAGLVSLLALVNNNTINNNTAKEVLVDMVRSGRSAEAIVQARGLAQISDEAALAQLVRQVIRDNPTQLASYLAGKEQLQGWFVGQIMKATRGKANPALVNELLSQQLAARKSAPE
ncbi:MAG: Asp-tRNA(Asn)/Glu-tRNA(Gln) amidotransferase subunit GatB, partial [Anaerolineales bacterium]|nr:Asp-tRNA(Asn)/Glu-tRNA(Gln) amidotransferase subunit GatB [Anaerolineales bacterium]